MSAVPFTSVPMRPAVFLPPSVPLLITDDDRYVWTRTGDMWTRTNGWWVPSQQDGLNDGQDDGTGWWSDTDVRAALRRAVETRDVRHRFVPATPGPVLPGRPLSTFPPARASSQYDGDAARYVPGLISGSRMRDVVLEVVRRQRRPRATYDEAAGRVYLRYDLLVDPYGCPPCATCLHVFVFTAGRA